jgi:hypothetical protein
LAPWLPIPIHARFTFSPAFNPVDALVKIVGKAEAAEMSAEFFKKERLEFDFNVIYLDIINNDSSFKNKAFFKTNSGFMIKVML